MQYAGAGQNIYECDYCGVRLDATDLPIFDGAPYPWLFIAMGIGEHLENADDVWHFCSKDHLIAYVREGKIEKARLNELREARAI